MIGRLSEIPEETVASIQKAIDTKPKIAEAHTLAGGNVRLWVWSGRNMKVVRTAVDSHQGTFSSHQIHHSRT